MCHCYPPTKQGDEQMQLDELRQEMIELLTQIQPKLQEGVFSPDQFHTHFETPYRARTLQKLQAFEKAHKKNFLLCYQLWIEESDNLIDNKPGEWISAQCMNEECDFDLITPRPSLAANLSLEEHRRMLDQLVKQYPTDAIWNQKALSQMYSQHLNNTLDAAQQQMKNAANMREQAIRQAASRKFNSGLQNYQDHAVDALRYYAPAAGPLSSARTSAPQNIQRKIK
jgi:sulfite reductase alpha subunit-like flavoprotein